MSGVGFWEILFLFMIGLVVLGPKRLPQVANQLGTWVGQARRMTRVMKRQLEEELDFDKELNIRPNINPASHPPPHDDDAYSPLHQQPERVAAEVTVAESADTTVDDDVSAKDHDERTGGDVEQERDA